MYTINKTIWSSFVQAVSGILQPMNRDVVLSIMTQEAVTKARIDTWSDSVVKGNSVAPVAPLYLYYL